MAGRMNYGIRFGSSAFNASFRYDPAIDRGMKKAGFQTLKAGTLEAVLRAAKARGCTKQAKAKVTLPGKGAAPMAPENTTESEMITRVHRAINVLQFGLDALSEASAGTPRVNRKAIVDCITKLKKSVKG
jgi:hypothetical protein